MLQGAPNILTTVQYPNSIPSVRSIFKTFSEYCDLLCIDVNRCKLWINNKPFLKTINFEEALQILGRGCLQPPLLTTLIMHPIIEIIVCIATIISSNSSSHNSILGFHISIQIISEFFFLHLDKFTSLLFKLSGSPGVKWDFSIDVSVYVLIHFYTTHIFIQHRFFIKHARLYNKHLYTTQSLDSKPI